MRRQRFLLVPGNNSLSHVAKCLAVREALVRRGHAVLVTVSRKNAGFLGRLGIEHEVLPDIQENDDAGLPTVEWFREQEAISACVNAEVDLIRHWKPDRILGVFRFTIKAAAHVARVPYDSLLCGCLMPDSGLTLGYADGDPGLNSQRIVLNGFFKYGGIKASLAFERFGIAPVENLLALLTGERTFLWDFPEFVPRQRTQEVMHVGPISWDGWPCDAVDLDRITADGSPLAVVAFGTCESLAAVAVRMVRVLTDAGFRVLVAAGGRREILERIPGNGRVTVCSFAPLQKILPYADLLVSHGGQMTVFEALQQEVPVAVMPFQPEQAHNGVCLERIGCGRRLIASQCFQGNPRVYLDAFDRRTDDEIAADLVSLANDGVVRERLSSMKTVMERYRSVETLAGHLAGNA